MKLQMSMLRADNLTPLDENAYGNIRRDDNDGRLCFLTSTHFRHNGKFYIPAFKIHIDDTDDKSAHYDLAYSIDKETLTRFNYRAGYYFDTPKSSTDWGKAYSVGAVNPGLTYIHILKNGELYGKVHRLFVLPSSMNLNSYVAMLREINFIRRTLLIKSSGQTKSVLTEKPKLLRDADNWQQVLEYLDRRVEELAQIIKRISQLPRQQLNKTLKLQRLEKIRKFDGKILQQYLSSPNRQKYRVQAIEVSTNIFENRLLLNKLLRLKNFILKQDKQHNLNANNKRQNILYEIKRIIGSFDLAKWRDYSENIYSRWKFFEAKKTALAETFTKNINTNIISTNIEIRTLKITCRDAKHTSIKLTGGITITFRLNLDFEPILTLDNRRYRFNEIISNVAINQQTALFDALNNNNRKTIELTGQFNFSNAIITIFNINRMTLNGQIVNLNVVDTSNIKNFYVNQEIQKLTGYENAVMDYREVQNINRRLNNTRAGTKVLVDKIISNLDACIALNIFRNVEVKAENWHMTQIFTNDANYHRAYSVLKNLDEMFDFSFAADERAIIHEKTDKIYEYWILAKILEVLIVKLNWQVEGGGDNPVEVFRDFFDNRKTDRRAHITLIRAGNRFYPNDTRIEIYYDTAVKYSLSAPNCNLRPDYLFKVTSDNDERIFILDAKYRNYEQQGFNQWAAKDLQQVCVEKYINRLERETGKRVSMAFIVHTDNTLENKFLGKYVTYNGAVDIRCKDYINGIRGSLKQVGAFYLLPYDGSTFNQSELNLTLYFQMMFEYFMNQWAVCWRCGSDDVQIGELTTNGYRKKYYMRCEKCGAFWVKSHCKVCGNRLIKHYVNYHVESGGKWKVICPNCGY